tara:strand:- start:36 stop:281 length:246 start_codon:yes stop_codon:yes gene_type:complete
MESENKNEINDLIRKLCDKYQEERVSGQWYIAQTGLNKIAKVLGGEYKNLTKKQRLKFRDDCIDTAHHHGRVKTWWFYLNQ